MSKSVLLTPYRVKKCLIDKWRTIEWRTIKRCTIKWFTALKTLSKSLQYGCTSLKNGLPALRNGGARLQLVAADGAGAAVLQPLRDARAAEEVPARQLRRLSAHDLGLQADRALRVRAVRRDLVLRDLVP